MSVDTPTTTQEPDSSEVVLAVTDAALDSVLSIRAQEPDPSALALRVEVTGARRVHLRPLLRGARRGGRRPPALHGRRAHRGDPQRLGRPARGAELDLPRAAGQGGLVIRNPNRPDPLAGVELELSGDVAEKVTQLLDGSINPALDSHGGYASLVGVDDDSNVYVTMGGGCQGCAASAMTLRDGIRRAIKEAIPEVAEVIDTTPAAGESLLHLMT